MDATCTNPACDPMLGADEIETLIHRVLDDRDRMDHEKHKIQHQWIEQQIEAQKARRDLMLSLAKAVAQWSVVGILGTIWYYAQAYIKVHWH